MNARMRLHARACDVQMSTAANPSLANEDKRLLIVNLTSRRTRTHAADRRDGETTPSERE